MSESMVASLTLRIINEMNGGMDEVRGEFGAVEDSAKQLVGELDQVSAMLAEMKGPEQLQAEMQGLVTTAGEVAGSFDESKAAMAGVAGEIDSAITNAKTFGGVLDEDTAKIKTMLDELNQAHDPAFVSGGGGGGAGGAGGGGATGSVPPVTPPPPADEPDPDPDPDDPTPGKRKQAKKDKPAEPPGSLGDWIMGGIALASGYEGEKDYAKMQETALQIAIIEGYSGKEALHQAHNIMHESYNQAYLSRGNVDDIEQAYFNLIRQQLPKQMVDQMMGPLTEASTTYSTPVADLTQPLYNLADQFKLPGDQMAQGVGMLGAASHMGHYYFGDFSTGLPAVANQFEKMGDTGLQGEATAAAALEMVRKGTPDSGTASTDLAYLMTYMTSPMAIRFFDRSQRSKDLLGPNIMDLFEKYHIQPLDIPKYLDDERDKGVDPLNAMVDYMHSVGAGKMSPTDQAVVFNSLFHSTEASTAMQALVGHYDQFNQDQQALMKVDPDFLDTNFRTAIQGDSGGMSQLDLLKTYAYRLYGQNTWGLFGDTSGSPSQADANARAPGSSAFNIPITLTVNVDKSGAATATATPTQAPSWDNGLLLQYMPPPGVNLKVNQGSVLAQP